MRDVHTRSFCKTFLYNLIHKTKLHFVFFSLPNSSDATRTHTNAILLLSPTRIAFCFFLHTHRSLPLFLLLYFSAISASHLNVLIRRLSFPFALFFHPFLLMCLAFLFSLLNLPTSLSLSQSCTHIPFRWYLTWIVRFATIRTLLLPCVVNEIMYSLRFSNRVVYSSHLSTRYFLRPSSYDSFRYNSLLVVISCF